MEFIEYPDTKALKSLINIPYINRDKAGLEAYLKLSESGNGVSVHYEQTYYNGNPYGRFYPQLKLKGQYVKTAQSQWKHIRSALYGTTETDIDLVNAQPTILFNICQDNGITASMLGNYVRNRDRFLDTELNVTEDDLLRYNTTTSSSDSLKDFRKAIVIATINGCSNYKKQFHLNDNPFNDNRFKTEITRVVKHVIDLPAYSNIVSDIRKGIPGANNGALISFILQEEEVKLVKHAIIAFQEQAIEVSCLIHDGFHVRTKDNALIDSILQTINNDIYPNRFIRKPFATSIFDIDINVSDDSDKDVLTASDDEEAVDIFLKSYGDRLVFCADWLIRPKNSYFWLIGEEAVKREISTMHINKKQGDRIVPYSSNASGCKSIFATLCYRRQDYINDEFISTLNQQNEGIIHFKDKHWNMRNKTWHNNDPSSHTGAILYINETAPDFTGLNKEHHIYKSISEKVFSMLDEDQFTDLMTVLSRAIGGHITDKMWVALESVRDGGKSTIARAIELCFPNYVESGIAPPFSRKYTGDSSSNRWIIARKLHLARIAWCNEKESTVDSNGKSIELNLNGNLIKRLASGGADKMEVRSHYGNEMKITVNATFFFNFNGMPKTDPADAIKTAIPFTLIKEYTDDPDKLQTGGVYLKADKAMAAKIFDPEYIRVLRWIIMDCYYKQTPIAVCNLKSVKDVAEELRSSAVSLEHVVFNNHVIIDQTSEGVDSDLVLERFNQYGVPWSKTKLTRWLKQMVPGFDNKMMTKDKQNKRYYTCIRLKDIEEPDLQSAAFC
jgi:hypothetical protein